MKFQDLNQKKDLLNQYRPLPDVLVRNLDDWFRVELTYTSNAIEGNTLTRQETALIIEKGLTVGGKTLIAYLNALEEAQLGGSKQNFYGLIIQAVDRSLDIYLKAVVGETA